MKLRHKEFIALLATFLLATIVILWLWPMLLDGATSLSSGRLDTWKEQILFPTLWVSYGLGILFLVIWIGKAFTSCFTRAQEVLGTKALWWILAFILAVIPIVFLGLLSFFRGWFDDSRNLEPFFWLFGFLILDVLFIYWLPTAIATPRSMRYVPPGSMLLRKIYRG